MYAPVDCQRLALKAPYRNTLEITFVSFIALVRKFVVFNKTYLSFSITKHSQLMNQNFSMTFKIHTSTDTRQEVSILHCSDKTKNTGHFLAREKTGFNNLSTSRTVIHNTR